MDATQSRCFGYDISHLRNEMQASNSSLNDEDVVRRCQSLAPVVRSDHGDS
jgi:hypothetical protein